MKIRIEQWTGSASGDIDEITTGALRIEAEGQVFTGNILVRSASVADVVYVSAAALAEWLVVHAWRLSWENRPATFPLRRPPALADTSTTTWRAAHSLAAIGRGFAWPDLHIFGDGERVTLALAAEDRADVAPVRYLGARTVSVSRQAFQRATDELVAQVLERLAACRASDDELGALHAELIEERNSQDEARKMRLLARAGIDAPDMWPSFAPLAERVGEGADELFAALPDTTTSAAELALQDIESATRIELSWIPPQLPPSWAPGEPAWKAAKAMAAEVRQHLGWRGPISNEALEGALQCSLPSIRDVRARVRGAHRDNGHAHVAVRPSPTARRFDVARTMGALCVTGGRYALVTDAYTPLQQFERAFAQELLCPWSLLEPHVHEHGTSESAREEAAELFGVSERTIHTALVNNHALPREEIVGR